MRPKLRYNLLLLSCAGALLLTGTELHRRAFNARLRALDRRLDAVEDALRGWGETPPVKAVNPPGPEGSLEPEPSKPKKQHRILGMGRCAGRIYADVRFADGDVRRYYCRTNAPRAEVEWWLDSMRLDGLEHAENAIAPEGAITALDN